jgi:hypothetical protein
VYRSGTSEMAADVGVSPAVNKWTLEEEPMRGAISTNWVVCATLIPMGVDRP